MAFRNPEILYALFALLIPLIIHLFNFRRYTTIYFSSVERLLSIQKDTRSKSKLKNLLILLSRLLLFASLIFAFAGPFIPSADEELNQKEKIIGICLDNSFSMQAANEKGVLLDQAINTIQDALNTLPAGQKLLFFTNDPNPGQSRILSRDQLIKLLGETSYSAQKFDADRTINQFNRLISDLPASYKLQRELWLFSDFQLNSFSLSDLQADSTLKWQLFPFSPTGIDNLSIDSCWFDHLGHLPNEPEILKVKITNHSANPVTDIPLRLMIRDSLRAVSTVSLKGKEQIFAELNYQLDQQSFIDARIELDDYPVTFDNSLYYSYLHNQQIRVVEIGSQETKVWKNLFEVESFFEYQFMPANSINYAELEQCNLIVLNALPALSTGLLSKILEYTEQGISLILVPDMNANPAGWNPLLETAQLPLFANKVNSKNEISLKSFDHPFLKKSILSKQENPRLPFFQNYFGLQSTAGSSYVRLLFGDQNQLFSYSGSLKSAQILVFASDLSPKYTNLTDHPLFLPLVYGFAFSALGHQDLYQIIGQQNTISLPILSTQINTIEVSEPDGLGGFNPSINKLAGRLQLQIGPYIRKAGNYLVQSENKLLAISAWNYQRSESILDFMTFDELNDLIRDENLQMMKVIDWSSNSSRNEIIGQEGVALWRWFVVLALLFLALELVLVRFSMNRDS